MADEVRRRPGRPPRVREDDEEIIVEPDESFVSEVGLEHVIVARGRTLVLPHPTKTKIVRQDEDGKTVRAPITIECGEETEVTLDASEAERLIKLGIVRRPGEPQMIPAALSEGSRVVEIGTPRGQISPVNQAMRS